MRKKFIFVGLCFVLLLVFVSSSYGGEDPKYKLKAHPWQDAYFCPAQDSSAVVDESSATISHAAAFLAARVFLGSTLFMIGNVSDEPSWQGSE